MISYVIYSILDKRQKRFWVSNSIHDPKGLKGIIAFENGIKIKSG
jgi:hypothetical protein